MWLFLMAISSSCHVTCSLTAISSSCHLLPSAWWSLCTQCSCLWQCAVQCLCLWKCTIFDHTVASAHSWCDNGNVLYLSRTVALLRFISPSLLMALNLSLHSDKMMDSVSKVLCSYAFETIRLAQQPDLMEALSQVLKLFVFSSLKGKDIEPHEPELKCWVCEVIWTLFNFIASFYERWTTKAEYSV